MADRLARDLARACDRPSTSVHEFGGAGPPVLLAHATGLHGLVWRPLASQLTGAGLRCVAYDARGHGDAVTPPGWDFGWRGLAEDALAVVDQLGLDHPHGLGHSSGATVLLLAEEARPGTFRSLYCFEPVIVPQDPPLGPDADSWLATAALRRRARFPSRDAARANYRRKAPWSTAAPEALDAYVEHGFTDRADGTVALKCLPEHEARLNEMATAHDCFGRMAAIRCPVRVAVGADSEEQSPAWFQRHVVPRLCRGDLDVVPGVSHLGPLQDPAAVARSFLQFVAATTSTTHPQ